jgi:4-aminobutyrate aminotransferase-like enzyme
MGLDVFANEGTPVFALADGMIHSFADNDVERDYGPTVIIQHTVSHDLIFYTLYGHLSRSSLRGLSPGMMLKTGDRVGEIGSRKENGNWPPHLHLQVMLDDLEMRGDFPGVANYRHREVWRQLSPDPWLLIAGRESAGTSEIDPLAILDERSKRLGRNLSISYQSPLTIVRGFGQYLLDHTGRRYLDTVNNVSHVGHEHPRVVRAGQRQMAVLNTNTRYLHPNIIRFSDELLSTFPAPLEVAFVVNSGSEANELAMRLAKTYTGHRDMVVVQVGYHGNTNACVEISSYKFDGKGGTGAPEHVHVVPIPDAYRGLYRGSDAGAHYARHVAQAVQAIRQKGRGVAAFICESVLSCGGQVVLPDGYLRDAYAAIRKSGGLCIADEVQTGVGRAGDHFWAFEAQGVVPDIVTVGKPIGNGHPLGVVVTTRAIADAFANGMEYFNTFGGNPVSCAIGSEVLRVVRDEGLQAHAKELGRYLTAGLIELMERFDSIGDVRGPGLFLGFELVKDRTSLEPATAQAGYLVNRMRECGILMSTDGPFNNVIKIKPPMVITRRDIDYLLRTLEVVLGEDSMAV